MTHATLPDPSTVASCLAVRTCLHLDRDKTERIRDKATAMIPQDAQQVICDKLARDSSPPLPLATGNETTSGDSVDYCKYCNKIKHNSITQMV